jgi:hypothetical protein
MSAQLVKPGFKPTMTLIAAGSTKAETKVGTFTQNQDNTKFGFPFQLINIKTKNASKEQTVQKKDTNQD